MKHNTYITSHYKNHMAILKTDKQEIIVPDGSPILDYAKELGVNFGCHSGICGTCLVTVEEGMENLFPRNSAEEEMGLSGTQRLCCQARIREGIVKIRQ